MYVIALNHYKSAGMNGFYEQAIVTKQFSKSMNGFMHVKGFLTEPWCARNAAAGVCFWRYVTEPPAEEVEAKCAHFFDEDEREFMISLSSIAYIEKLEGKFCK